MGEAATTVEKEASSIQSEHVIDSDDSVFDNLHTTSNDVLRELYWYVLRAHQGHAEQTELVLIDNVVATLGEEGIWFWRDERFQKSQDVALQMAQHAMRTALQLGCGTALCDRMSLGYINACTGWVIRFH